MVFKQGDIVWIDLNPSRGTGISKKRPCVIVSNNNYNHFFNTALILPISSSSKYQSEQKYIESPFFIPLHSNKIYGTILLQHLRAVNINVRSNGEVVDVITDDDMQVILTRLKMFF